ncbi:MAG TPA: thioredoxin domain-containing protein [Candidatus Woesebacteria bacterium]|nr:thioredoxin domain-containing protein [Candidatus Woesebacteria bacterium]
MAKKNLLFTTLDFFNANFLAILLVFIIYFAGILSGIYWQNRNKTDNSDSIGANSGTPQPLPTTVSTINQTPPISAQDHVIGATNPKLWLVEYSDFSCGFCSRVHPTLKQLIAEYPNDVAWVYRHYLLSETGPSRVMAEASECVANISGNQAFWNYINAFFDRYAQGGVKLEQESLIALAKELGYNSAQLSSCITSKQYAQKIDEDIAGGRKAGVSGTPNIMIITSDGKFDQVAGAAPIDDFKKKIEQYL